MKTYISTVSFLSQFLQLQAVRGTENLSCQLGRKGCSYYLPSKPTGSLVTLSLRLFICIFFFPSTCKSMRGNRVTWTIMASVRNVKTWSSVDFHLPTLDAMFIERGLLDVRTVVRGSNLLVENNVILRATYVRHRKSLSKY